MPILSEFHFFPRLPTELRVVIWNLQQEPERIVGLVPPREAWFSAKRLQPTDAPGHEDSPLTFRYISQPRDLGVFPPLHVCRESRAIWLARVFQTPRQIKAAPSLASSPDDARVTVQFDTPFIHYESDIFTVLDTWVVRELFPNARGISDAAAASPIDPFTGLDTMRIRRVGLCEIPYGTEHTVNALNIQSFPKLEEFSIIALGPDALTARVPQFEMPIVDLQCVDCELSTLSSETMHSSRFFTQARLDTRLVAWPDIRPFPKYEMLVKAWLWHTLLPGWLLRGIDRAAAGDQRWKFMHDIVHQQRDEVCTLPFEVCAGDGDELSKLSHTIAEILDWNPPFRVTNKFLCARECAGMVANLMASGVVGGDME